MRRWLRVVGWLLFSTCNLANAQNILVLGDSISASFGMDSQQGWVSLLEKRLDQEGISATVVNASISGETSAGGLSRLPSLLSTHQPRWLILELGGNDGLRGTPLLQVQQNLSTMIRHAQQSGAKVLLLGMQLPPNYGPRYGQGFADLYPRLAKRHDILLVPFFLEGVGGVSAMMQGDGIHPTVQAQPILLENVWTVLKEHL